MAFEGTLAHTEVTDMRPCLIAPTRDLASFWGWFLGLVFGASFLG